MFDRRIDKGGQVSWFAVVVGLDNVAGRSDSPSVGLPFLLEYLLSYTMTFYYIKVNKAFNSTVTKIAAFALARGQAGGACQ